MNNSKFLLPVVIVILVAAAVGVFYWNTTTRPDAGVYQVVLLRNDQAFYGKLKDIHSDYPYLVDVYYLNPQPIVDEKGNLVRNGQSKFTVVKRGIDEIHAPSDRLYISRENIMYWENIGPNSLVAQGIKADKDVRSGKAPAK